MVSDNEQVAALKLAILKRAGDLSEEHIQQGKMTAEKILEDMREKIQLMEQKELLSAKVHADRAYQRKVQASELRMQAEQDRNRWGLAQSVLELVIEQINAIHDDSSRYDKMFRALLKQSVKKIGPVPLVAYLNKMDQQRYSANWQTLVQQCCGKAADIQLASELCECSGGFKLTSETGDMMLDYTFEGVFQRKDAELQRLIFERMFSSAKSVGSLLNG